MHPGKTSDALRVKLRQVGSRISDEQLATAWHDAEKSRVSFSCSAVALGVMLHAKKQAIGHSKWLPWCDKFGGKLAQATKAQIGTTVPILQEVTPRTLSKYTFVGEHFLAALEQGEFAGENNDHRPKLEGVTPDQILAIDTMPAKDRKAVFARIEQFVAGRSLRTMLLDFRRAENAAEDELAAHEREKKNKRGKADSAGASPGQMDFWKEMQRPLDMIETLCKSTDTLKHADKAFWSQLAAAFKEKMEFAQARAKEMTA